MYENVLIILLLMIIILHGALTVPKLDGRIIGGTPAEIYDYPYQLSLQYFDSHHCGAVLISNKYALTAAHCIDNVRGLSIYAGSRHNSRAGIRLTVQSVAVHKLYDEIISDYDIAIIKFLPVKFSAKILPIALAEYNEEIPIRTNATVTGWGCTKEKGFPVTALRAVTVPIIDNETCRSMYFLEGTVTERMLCAGAISGGSDSCQGDSGGPLVAKGKLIGIVSWGYGCGRPNYPGVYTKISKLRNWIKVAIRQLE